MSIVDSLLPLVKYSTFGGPRAIHFKSALHTRQPLGGLSITIPGREQTYLQVEHRAYSFVPTKTMFPKHTPSLTKERGGESLLICLSFTVDFRLNY